MSRLLTENQIKAARSAITLLRHVREHSDNLTANGAVRTPETQEHYKRCVDILNMWDADEMSPEEQSLREAIGLGIGGRGVAEY